MNIATRAPTEILCEIFLLLCDMPIALHELDRSRLYEFPWAAGQVCRHWRSAFLSYPALWSSLSIEDPSDGYPSVAYVAEMERRTAIYLKRSEPHPLTVTVSVRSSFVQGFCNEAWDMLLSCSDRWKKLDLWISNEFFMDGLISRRGKMPILESLRLSVTKFKHRKDLTAFQIAPRLTELDLMHGVEGERGWGFPWAQLTKLTIDLPLSPDFADSHSLRAFLLQLQNVEELRFSISSVNEGFGALKSPPVRFARLRLLEISLVYPGVLSWFEAPLLEDLLAYCSPFSATYNPDECTRELSSLVHRSLCHIRRLTLRNCELEVAHSIMKALTSIEKLCIKYSSMSLRHGPRLVQDIAEADGIYLPNLQMLQLPCCPRDFERYVSLISYLFEVRNRKPRLESASSEMASLERLTVAVDGTDIGCWGYETFYKNMKSIDNALEAMCRWPSFSVTGLNTNTNAILTVCASAAGALVDLTIHYPKVSHYYLEARRRHYSILESKFPSASSLFINYN